MRRETVNRLIELKGFIDKHTPLTHADNYYSDDVYEVCEWAMNTWDNVSVMWKRDGEEARIAFVFHHFTNNNQYDQERTF